MIVILFLPHSTSVANPCRNARCSPWCTNMQQHSRSSQPGPRVLTSIRRWLWLLSTLAFHQSCLPSRPFCKPSAQHRCFSATILSKEKHLQARQGEVSGSSMCDKGSAYVAHDFKLSFFRLYLCIRWFASLMPSFFDSTLSCETCRNLTSIYI